MAGGGTLFSRIPKTGDPYVGGFAITPSDTVKFTSSTRAIFVGGAGTVTVVMADGTRKSVV